MTTPHDFISAWDRSSAAVHTTAKQHGWWDDGGNDGEKIALMHSELSECLESMRHGDPASDHIPDFKGSEEELADVIIRIMDFAVARGLRVSEAVVAKMIYNEDRPHKHGGKKF